MLRLASLLVCSSTLSLASAALGGPASGGSALEAEDPPPSRIWLDETTADQEVVFRRTFALEARPERAWLAGSCDDHMIVLVNGRRVAAHGDWRVVAGRDVAEHLVGGENSIEVRARNDGGPAGLALRLVVEGRPTPAVVRRILRHLRLPTEPLPLAPAREPPRPALS